MDNFMGYSFYNSIQMPILCLRNPDDMGFWLVFTQAGRVFVDFKPYLFRWW
jgi:hypothetical protein